MKLRLLQRRFPILGCIVLILLMIDVLLKSPENRQEIMWACYWASTSVATGMLFGSDRLVSGGVIFLAGLGIPAWLLSTLVVGQMEIISVLFHIVPFVAGSCYVLTMASLPRYAATLAWLLYAVPFALSWQFCEPGTMINLSHWTRWPIPGLLPYKWQFYIVLLIASLTMVTLIASTIRSILTSKSVLKPFGPQL